MGARRRVNRSSLALPERKNSAQLARMFFPSASNNSRSSRYKYVGNPDRRAGTAIAAPHVTNVTPSVHAPAPRLVLSGASRVLRPPPRVRAYATWLDTTAVRDADARLRDGQADGPGRRYRDRGPRRDRVHAAQTVRAHLWTPETPAALPGQRGIGRGPDPPGGGQRSAARPNAGDAQRGRANARGVYPSWCWWRDSNPHWADFKSAASAAWATPARCERRRADSNRCIEVLQTSPLATWVRRRRSRRSYHAPIVSGKLR